jgi:hypothetical protein
VATVIGVSATSDLVESASTEQRAFPVAQVRCFDLASFVLVSSKAWTKLDPS